MTVKNLIISIIIGLVVFAVGGGAGVLYQQQKGTPATQTQSGAENPILKTLNSKVVSSINASGQVSDIAGRDITLTLGGDDLIIRVRDDAPVYSFVQPINGKNAVQKTVKFEDIRKGNTLNVNLYVSSGNVIEASSVLMFQK